MAKELWPRKMIHFIEWRKKRGPRYFMNIKILDIRKLSITLLLTVALCLPFVSSRSECHQHKMVFRSNVTGIITDGDTDSSYKSNQRCEWLILSPDPDEMPFITLDFMSKKTECTYDYIMVHDGDTKVSPLLATLSGDSTTGPPHRIMASSGKMLIYLFSDINTDFDGFSATFSINHCPNNCSGNGACRYNKCHCDDAWTGEDCSQPACPYNCEDVEHGHCRTETESRKCNCKPGYIGVGCGMSTHNSGDEDRWTIVYNYTGEPGSGGRAGHAGVFIDPHFYIFGGYNMNEPIGEQLRYNFQTNEWLLLHSSIQPSPRYFHTITALRESGYGANYLLLYGGDLGGDQLSDETWVYDTLSGAWRLQSLPTWQPAPPGLCQHAAALVEIGPRQYVYIYGGRTLLSPDEGLSSLMYRFDWTSKMWQKLNYDPSGVRKAKLRVAGHSMVYDKVDRTLVVFGGFRMDDRQKAVYSSVVFLYNVDENRWAEVKKSGKSRSSLEPFTFYIKPRVFHTANIVGDYMVVYGGNTHSNSCYSMDIHFYHLRCHSWLSRSGGTLPPGRYSHTSAVINDTVLLVHGGYNGVVCNNLLAYKLPQLKLDPPHDPDVALRRCSQHLSKRSCVKDVVASCVWQRGICTNSIGILPSCDSVCSSLEHCVACTSFRSYVRNENYEWEARSCGWCVQDSTCYAKGSDAERGGVCGDKPSKFGVRPWWGGNKTTLLNDPSSCLGNDLSPGVIAAEYLPNPNFSQPDKVTLLHNIKYEPSGKRGMTTLDVINHVLIIRGFFHPHILPGDHLLLRLIATNGKAEFNISSTKLPSGARSVARVSQSNNRAESISDEILMTDIVDSRCFIQIQFTHTGDSIWTGKIEAEWDTGHLGQPFLKEHRNFQPFTPDVLEPFQSELLPASEKLPLCEALSNCLACLTDMSCAWCESRALCVRRSILDTRPYWCSLTGATVLSTHAGMITYPGSCTICPDYATCHHCVSDRQCEWHSDKCARRGRNENGTTELTNCPVPCNQRSTCEECLPHTNSKHGGTPECAWCASMQKCYKFTSYHLTAYSFGQCANWVDSQDQCPGCQHFNTCKSCLDKYECGWCSNAKNPLQGYCTEGGFSSPYSDCSAEYLTLKTNSNEIITQMLWNYSSCPDVNECDLEWPPGNRLHRCHVNAACLNTLDTYHCRCRSGYLGDGFRCERTCLTECVNGRCSGPPDYRCICDLGWTSSNSENEVPLSECDIDCGCNFLSTCESGQGVCDQCQRSTTGGNCSECILGHFHGQSIQDGCRPCECNGHGIADLGWCDQNNGTCSCKDHTTGPSCQFCEEGYYGDPRNGGTCYRMCDGRTKMDMTDMMTGGVSGAFGSWNIAEREMGSLLRRRRERIDVTVVNCEWVVEAANVAGYDPTVRITMQREINVTCYTNHILIYDGVPGNNKSVLLGAFCGQKWENDIVVLAHSGIATVQYTDVLPFIGQHTTGFNATFDIPYPLLLPDVEEEPYEESGDYSGGGSTEPPVETPLTENFTTFDFCMKNCSEPLGQGYCQNGICHCAENYTGPDCTTSKADLNVPVITQLEWDPDLARAYQHNVETPLSSLGHSLTSTGHYLWLFGGFSPENGVLDELWRYDTYEKVWLRHQSNDTDSPSARYHHAVAKHPTRNAFYIFGGILKDGYGSSELWLFDEDASEWSAVKVNESLPSLAGHTMTFCGKTKAYIIGGYSTHLGFNQNVWVFNLEDGSINPLRVRHIKLPHIYGHSTICDEATKQLYVFGGLKNSLLQLPVTTDLMYVFDSTEEKLSPVFLRVPHPLSPSPRAFHSSIIYESGPLKGMLMIGGLLPSGDTSEEIWLFIFACNIWIKLRSEDGNIDDLSVPALASVTQIDDEYYIYGGSYHGLISSNLMLISDIKPCFVARNARECSNMPTKCKICTDPSDRFVCLPQSYDRPDHSCVQEGDMPDSDIQCEKEVPVECTSLRDCKTCLLASLSATNPDQHLCHWCPATPSTFLEKGNCQPSDQPCPGQDTSITSRRECNHCFAASCSSCNLKSGCQWRETEIMYKDYNKILKTFSCHVKSVPGDWDLYYTTAPTEGEPLQPAVPIVNSDHVCPTSCATHVTCDSCLGFDDWHDKWRDCVWSPGLVRCLEPAYVPLLCKPGGTCGVLASKGPISCPASSCSHLRYCWECIYQAGCGWTVTGSSGVCQEGSSEGPSGQGGSVVMDWWYFECPAKDECSEGWHDCMDDSENRETCHDLDQGFECVCQDGYGRSHPFLPCTPVCSGGCIHGNCVEPDNCQCDFGYTGKSCQVACQCNGHSECQDAENPDRCILCLHNTTGPQCDYCLPLFVGDPTKNQTCVPCKTVCGLRTEICTSKSNLSHRHFTSDLIGSRGPTLEDVACIGCRNNSQGDRCDECKDGFFMYEGHCRPCQCNGHSDKCDRNTGGFCVCRNHTVTSDPKCNIPITKIAHYPSHCWKRQCDKCMEPYEGNPQNGGQCYRKVMMEQEMCFNPLSLSPCLAGDYTPHVFADARDEGEMLPSGQAILFALSPKYTNVDIRVMVDITFGELTLYISDRPDTFQIQTDPVTGKHVVVPNKQLVDTAEVDPPSPRRSRESGPIPPRRLKRSEQQRTRVQRSFEDYSLVEEYLKELSKESNPIERSKREDPPTQESDIAVIFHPKVEKRIRKKIKLTTSNGTNFNSFARLLSGTALEVKNVQNRLIVSIPHTNYDLRSTKFYVILLGSQIERSIPGKPTDLYADDHRDKRAVERHPADKTVGLLQFRQDQTHIDLFVFFSVFFSCFFLFLAICIVTWKVKQALDLRQAQRARHIEMKHMASRPFACVYVSLSNYAPEPMLGKMRETAAEISPDQPAYTNIDSTSQLFQARSCPIFTGSSGLNENGAGTSGFSTTCPTEIQNSSSLTLRRKPFQKKFRRKISARKGMSCLSMDLSAHSAPHIETTTFSQSSLGDIATSHRKACKSTEYIDPSCGRLSVSHNGDQMPENRIPLFNSTSVYIKEIPAGDRGSDTILVPSSVCRTSSPSFEGSLMDGVQTEACLGKEGKVMTVSKRKKRPRLLRGEDPSGSMADAGRTTRTKFSSTPNLPADGAPSTPVTRVSSMRAKSPMRTLVYSSSTPDPKSSTGRINRGRFSSWGNTKQQAKKPTKSVSAKTPGPIACEPTENGIASISTVILQLPGGTHAPVFACLGSSLVINRNVCCPSLSDSNQVAKPHFKSRRSKIF